MVFKKAFTLVEILVVISLITMLITYTNISLQQLWRNNQIDLCESEIKDISAGFMNYFIDYGRFIVPNDLNYSTVLSEMIEILNTRYLPYQLQINTINDNKRSVILSAQYKTDPWGKRYQIFLYTYSGEDSDSIPGLIVVSSNGPDNKNNSSAYLNEDYRDDIIAVIEPKEIDSIEHPSILLSGNTVTLEESRYANLYFIGTRKKKEHGIDKTIFQFMTK